jgi:hypothetical protein
MGTRAHHALDGRFDKDIAQESLAVRAHDDEIRSRGRSGPQDAVERVAGDDQRIASDAVQLGHYADLFTQNSFGLAGFKRD